MPGGNETSPRLGLSLGRFGVDLIGAGGPLAAWLGEALLPGVQHVPPASGRPTVTIRRLPRLVAAGVSSDRRAPCFAFDTGVRWLPSGVSDGHVELVDPAYGARYRLGPDGIEVAVAERGLAHRIAVFRAVRELLVAGALAAEPSAQLHAAGVVVDGRAVLIAGPKGAGKTTLAVHLAVSHGCALVANDRVLVRRPEGAHFLGATGVPAVVTIRPGTLERLPSLASGLPAARDAARRSLAELASGPPVRGGEPRRFTLLQVARAAGVGLVGEAPLAAVALVRVDDGVGDAAVRRMPPEEACGALRAARFGRAYAGRPPTVFEAVLGLEAPGDGSFLAEVAGTIPVLEVRMGPALLSSPAATSRLVQVVAGA